MTTDTIEQKWSMFSLSAYRSRVSIRGNIAGNVVRILLCAVLTAVFYFVGHGVPWNAARYTSCALPLHWLNASDG